MVAAQGEDAEAELPIELTVNEKLPPKLKFDVELPTLKVILTRMSKDAKVVFCGDLSQVDNPYISPFGGVAALIEKLKGSPLFGHVTLDKSVRSPLAEMAATTL